MPDDKTPADATANPSSSPHTSEPTPGTSNPAAPKPVIKRKPPETTRHKVKVKQPKNKKSPNKTDPNDPPTKHAWWHNNVKPILLVVIVVFVVRSLIIDWNDVPSGSMEPTIMTGDRIAVNRLAYQLNWPIPFLVQNSEGKGYLNLPFTDTDVPMPLPSRIVKWADPARGDIVITWSPEDEADVEAELRDRGVPGWQRAEGNLRLVKRVVGIPGDHVVFDRGVLTINNETAQLDDDAVPDGVYRDPQSGPIPVIRFEETILGETRVIQWIDDEARHNNASQNNVEFTLGEHEYLCVGDDRDFSKDSRIFGVVHRDQIVGRAFAVAFSFEPQDNFLQTLMHPNWSRFFTRID